MLSKTTPNLNPVYNLIIRRLSFFIIFILLLGNYISSAQHFELGTPQIQNFDKEIYEASAQSWDVLSALGHVFIANNSGLVTNDGNTWRLYGMNTILRSMSYDDKDKIYCGGQNEIGYFMPNDIGELEYTSIRDSIKIKDDNLGEIWNVNIYQDTLWFSSENNLISYSNGESKVHPLPGLISKMIRLGDELWCHSVGNGLFRASAGQMVPINGSKVFEDKLVVEMFVGPQDKVYVLTNKQGIYFYEGGEFRNLKTNANEYFESKRITCGAYHPDYGIVVGTQYGGVINLVNNKCILKLDRQNGLQNNSINCIGLSERGELWIGANNGIDHVRLSANRSTFYPDGELEGTIYDVAKWNNHLYVSSSTGLYYIKQKDYYNPLLGLNFKLIKGTDGQNWGLDVIDDNLYCAHHDGSIKVSKQNTISKTDDNVGSWKYVRLRKDKIAIGKYDGVYIYSLVNDRLQLDYKVPGLTETARILTLDNADNLWVSHPYDFVYRIRFENDFSEAKVTKYDADNGFRMNIGNYVFGINGTCYLTNESGAYHYNQVTDQFERADELNDLFAHDNHIRRLIQIDNEVWCITDRFTSRLTMNLSGLAVEFAKTDFKDIEARSNFVGGFENLFKYNDNTLFLCSDKGVVEYQMLQDSPDPLKAVVKNVQLSSYLDSIIYGGYGPLPSINLEPQLNAFVVQFGSNQIDPSAKIEYAYRLSGLDEEWSIWSNAMLKEYNHIPSGEYVFEVKTRNTLGIESEIEKIDIVIATPWSKTVWAYALYTLLFFGVFAAILFFQDKKFKNKAAELESTVQKTEEEIEIIKQEKLEEQIRFKNKELAMTTMNLLQKDETLKVIRQDIESVQKRIKDAAARKEVRKIINLLNSDDRLQEDWASFSMHFDQVHHGFIKRLRQEFPDLTPKDQKLCAYLRMNLSTKEIAPLLRISVRGIEISRYRLRKKLGLAKDVNLNTFMMDF